MNPHTTATALDGALVIRPVVSEDERGFFKETYVKSKYESLGIHDAFIQDSLSFSGRGVLRGLHSDPEMSKLVQVLRGSVYDVIVDTRLGSPTFGRWEGFELSEHNHHQLYVPAGFLHGFLALTDEVLFCYKQSAEYAPSREISVRYDDPTIAIKWPLQCEPRVSQKDLKNPLFADVFALI